ncbi:unnamed protein product [Durusdinium trenchii]|uniref:Uncharacterized protein n=1 Tax=Durusdinium trenchii TaxID=1381693 RepID=A0ABP0Q9H1_9DINO
MASSLSLVLNCPAVGIQSSWVVRLGDIEDGEDLKACIADFRTALHSKGLVTVEKEGEMSSGQELLLEGLLFQRLAEWKEKLRRCQQVEEEKQNWETTLQAIRVEYIREIEMYRLKLRYLERGKEPPDQRASSMGRFKAASVQTEMQSPFQEVLSLWEKSFDLQQRLDAVHRRNMAFEAVEDCVFTLQRAVMEDERRNSSLEKAFLEAVEAFTWKTLALHEAASMASFALQGRDIMALDRSELCPWSSSLPVARHELREMISSQSVEELEAIAKGEDRVRTEQHVLQLRRMVRSLQNLSDGDPGTVSSKKQHSVHGCVAAMILDDMEDEPELPEPGRFAQSLSHPQLDTIRKALASAKALNETLDLVKSVSQRWPSGPTSREVCISLPEDTEKEAKDFQAFLSSDNEDEPFEAVPSLRDQGPKTPVPVISILPANEVDAFANTAELAELPKEMSEHILEATEAEDYGAEVTQDLRRLEESMRQVGDCRREVKADSRWNDFTDYRGNVPVADASTMTPPSLLLSLLKSKEVAWTSVPLGSEKDFQWSLMPVLAQTDEAKTLELPSAGDVEAGLKRIESKMLEEENKRSALPPHVLAGQAPGTTWPSISPVAWSRIGGGLELARLTSEPRAYCAQRRVSRPAPPPAPVEEQALEEIDLKPITSAISYIKIAKPEVEQVPRKRKARREEREMKVVEQTEQDLSKQDVQDLQSLQDLHDLQQVQVKAQEEDLKAPPHHEFQQGRRPKRRLHTLEQQRDDKVVQQWLTRLRQPLAAVAKIEDLMKQEQTEQTLRHEPSCISGSAASDKEDEQYRRRFSRESIQSEMFFDEPPTEPNSRPSTAVITRPNSATPCANRGWSGAAARRAIEVRHCTVDDEAAMRPQSAPAEGQFLPRAPAFIARPLRRVGRPESSRESRPRPATADRALHMAYVFHRPVSAKA